MNIVWHDGLVLNKEVFNLQDDIIRGHHQSLVNLTFMPAALRLLSLTLDDSTFANGKIVITQLSWVDQHQVVHRFKVDNPVLGVSISMPSSDDKEYLKSVYVTIVEKLSSPRSRPGDSLEVLDFVPKLSYAESEHTGACLKLFEVIKSERGRWQLSQTFIPPVCFCNETYFEPILSKIESSMHSVIAFIDNETVSSQLDRNILTVELLKIKKMALYMLYRTQVVRSNQRLMFIDDLYDELYKIYIEATFLKNVVSPENQLLDYRDIGASFDRLLNHISQLGELTIKNKLHVRLVKSADEENMYMCELPPKVKHARHVFLVIKKQQMNQVIDVSNLTVACASRIHNVLRLSIPGVKLKPYYGELLDNQLNRVVCEAFEMERTQEWAHILEESNVVMNISHRQDQEDLSYYLLFDLPSELHQGQGCIEELSHGTIE